MGSASITIVPRTSKFENKEEKAKEIIAWLIEIDAIKPNLSKCVLGLDDMGYAISDGAQKIVSDPKQLPVPLSANGLEITYGREIFTAMANGISELICPNCEADISDEDWNFFNEWHSGDSDNLTCPKCQTPSRIHNYKFDPVWGFSDLGFVFWNWWGFNQEFLWEFEDRLQCKIDVVYARF